MRILITNKTQSYIVVNALKGDNLQPLTIPAPDPETPELPPPTIIFDTGETAVHPQLHALYRDGLINIQVIKTQQLAPAIDLNLPTIQSAPAGTQVVIGAPSPTPVVKPAPTVVAQNETVVADGGKVVVATGNHQTALPRFDGPCCAADRVEA